MVSFDVKSLFTNVPIDDVLIILMKRLQNDVILSDRTNMDPSCICHLTELCIRSTFQGEIFKQLKGTAIMNGISTTTGFCQHLYGRLWDNSTDVCRIPTIWKRYVDNTFVIWPHGKDKLDHFLQHINTLHRDITFTVEIKNDHKIAFLDVQIIRNDNTLETLVDHKPTHTNQYLNFRSNHHPRVKLGIIQCLTQRVKLRGLQGRRIEGSVFS